MSEAKKHSMLAPSAASRWTACTPSAVLADKIGDTGSSVHADEGSLAHRLAEIMLLNALQQRNTGTYLAALKADLAAVEGNPLYYTDMDAEVDEYVSYTLDLLARSKGARMYVEAEIPLFYRPEDTGTIDNLIVGGADKTLYVTDLKFGRGVIVNAKNNKQLLIYAINAYDRFRGGYDIERVVVTIVQPRRNHVDTWEIGLDDLEIYRDQIAAKARKAAKGEGNFKPGEHCQFCPVKPRCKALKELAANTAGDKKFEDPAVLTDAEIAQLLGSVDIIADWVASVKKYAYDRMVEGVKYEGFKLVTGGTRRQIADEKAIIKALTGAGYEPSLLRRSSFVTLTELQKAIEKEDFETHCTPYIVAKELPPVMADATDPRPEHGVAQAAKDFKEYINN